MPKEHEHVGSTTAILAVVPIFAVNSDESLSLQFLDVHTSLRFAHPSLIGQRINGWISGAVFAGVPAQLTVDDLGGGRKPAVLAYSLRYEDASKETVGVERVAWANLGQIGRWHLFGPVQKQRRRIACRRFSVLLSNPFLL